MRSTEAIGHISIDESSLPLPLGMWREAVVDERAYLGQHIVWFLSHDFVKLRLSSTKHCWIYMCFGPIGKDSFEKERRV